MGPDVMILVFLIFSFKPALSLSSFALIKRLFSIINTLIHMEMDVEAMEINHQQFSQKLNCE